MFFFQMVFPLLEYNVNDKWKESIDFNQTFECFNTFFFSQEIQLYVSIQVLKIWNVVQKPLMSSSFLSIEIFISETDFSQQLFDRN